MNRTPRPNVRRAVSNPVKLLFQKLARLSGVWVLVCLLGCGDPPIEVYTVPPEPPRVETPKHWEDVETSSMLAAEKQRFEIPLLLDGNATDDNATTETPIALATLTVLPGSGDRRNRTDEELERDREDYLRINVNRWRGQLSLEDLPEEDNLKKHLSEVKGLPKEARMVDINGTAVRPPYGPARTVGILIPRVNALWVYKLSGDARVVEQERENFLRILPRWN